MWGWGVAGKGMVVVKLGPVGVPSTGRHMTSRLHGTVLSGRLGRKRGLALRDMTRRLGMSVAPIHRTFRVLTRSKLVGLEPGGKTVMLKVARACVERRCRLENVLRNTYTNFTTSPSVSVDGVRRSCLSTERVATSKSCDECTSLGHRFRDRV